ncbi:MAG: helix-turn-helix transcriptional regulator [Lachnospiraceae bacterium]|nr:helix-turn-helix transcriptional regulator [Lachnospiraceae bacterium]
MAEIDLKGIIGNRIREYRLENRLTQAEFAEIMDISVNFLSEIENGKKGMSQDTIYRLCKHFHLSADYIIFGLENTVIKTAPCTLDDIINYVSKMPLEELDTFIEYVISLKKLKEHEKTDQV